MPDSEQRDAGLDIPVEFQREVRKQVTEQAAKWTIGALVAISAFALLGWWFYFKPMLIEIVGGVPTGSVISFDIRDRCPTGWSPFEAANGRFVLAAGRGDGLTPRPFGLPGGAETHTLTLSQMPSHSHSYIDWGSGPGSCSFSGCDGQGGDQNKITRATGGTATGATEAFEIMPPYIALRFCKKD